jgi:FtsZ-binding cell division protein ZapB
MGNLYSIQTGTEIILSRENMSLKEKNKELSEEIKKLTVECERLTDENIKYKSRLDTILKTAVGALCND